MSGRFEKMKRLIAERDRLKAQLEALSNQLKGLELAIDVLSRDERSEQETGAVRPRARNVKDTVLTIVQNAGDAGVTVVGVMDAAMKNGIHLERGTVSSLLSRMKRENVLDMNDGRYFVAKSANPTLQLATH